MSPDPDGTAFVPLPGDPVSAELNVPPVNPFASSLTNMLFISDCVRLNPPMRTVLREGTVEGKFNVVIDIEFVASSDLSFVHDVRFIEVNDVPPTPTVSKLMLEVRFIEGIEQLYTLNVTRSVNEDNPVIEDNEVF